MKLQYSNVVRMSDQYTGDGCAQGLGVHWGWVCTGVWGKGTLGEWEGALGY